MKRLVMLLWQLKPESLPSWLYVLILFIVFTIGLCVAAIGSWVLLTQIDYM